MLASVAQAVLARTAPEGKFGCLPVLIYHRVLAAPDPLLPNEPSASEFEGTMRWVKRTFNVIPLDEGVAGLKAGRLPARALSITFDDGYANNESIAAPILARLGLHARPFSSPRDSWTAVGCSTIRSSKRSGPPGAQCWTCRRSVWADMKSQPTRTGSGPLAR